MRKILFIPILTVVLLFGCTKEEAELRQSELDIPVIQGFIFRDEFGQVIRPVGTPDIKTYIGDDPRTSDYQFNAFPSPVTGEYIYLIARAPVTSGKMQFWITRAIYEYDLPGFSIDQSMMNVIAGGAPIIQNEIEIEPGYNNMLINVSNFEEGYYRAYLKVDEHLLFDNIVILKSNLN